MKPEWKVGDRCAVYSHAGRDVGTFDGPSPSGREGIMIISTGSGLETKKIWAHHKQVRRLIKRPRREWSGEWEITMDKGLRAMSFTPDDADWQDIKPGMRMTLREVRGKK